MFAVCRLPFAVCRFTFADSRFTIADSRFTIHHSRPMIHILGIRHHGPGSARNVKEFLEEIKPDIVLVEGPPEADEILQWSSHKELKPPVAILCYQPDNPQQSSFYPFAEF